MFKRSYAMCIPVSILFLMFAEPLAAQLKTAVRYSLRVPFVNKFTRSGSLTPTYSAPEGAEFIVIDELPTDYFIKFKDVPNDASLPTPVVASASTYLLPKSEVNLQKVKAVEGLFFGVLSAPFRWRISSNLTDDQSDPFSSSISLGPSIGYSWGIGDLLTITLAGTVGYTNQSLPDLSTADDDTRTYNGFVTGGALIFTIHNNPLQLGAEFGRDFYLGYSDGVGGKLTYQPTWFAISLGYNFVAQ